MDADNFLPVSLKAGHKCLSHKLHLDCVVSGSVVVFGGTSRVDEASLTFGPEVAGKR